MNYIKSTFGFVFIVLNLIVGLGLLIGAYGQYLSPVMSPVLSIAGLGFPFFVVLNLVFLLFWLLVRSKYALLPFVLFVLAGDALLTYSPLGFSSSPKGGKVLKVLTYNVMGMNADNKSKKTKVYPTLEYIKKSGADIVCLQEFPADHQEIIRQAKSIYPYIKVVTFHAGLEVACFSKTPILSSETIDMISPGNGSAVFYVEVDNHKIPVIVNHLESNKLSGNDKEIYEALLGDPQGRLTKSGNKHLLFKLADAASLRGPQAKVIAKKIKDLNNPRIIVCGDFNDTPLSYTHRVIGEGLQDTYREAGFGPAMTYHEHFMYFRIDHILVGQSYRVLKCKIDNDIKASDHYPYWCEIEL